VDCDAAARSRDGVAWQAWFAPDRGRITAALLTARACTGPQESLSLFSITIVADTCTSVLPQFARESAEDVAALIRPTPVQSLCAAPRGKATA
jgi:hypothetical protein